MVTIIIEQLKIGTGPLYCRIADGIEKAINLGTLKGGDRLPAQRDLAYDIGVTLGTVSRAYSLARQRGLVYGEVGRGTFVIERDVTSTQLGYGSYSDGNIAPSYAAEGMQEANAPLHSKASQQGQSAPIVQDQLIDEKNFERQLSFTASALNGNETAEVTHNDQMTNASSHRQPTTDYHFDGAYAQDEADHSNFPSNETRGLASHNQSMPSNETGELLMRKNGDEGYCDPLPKTASSYKAMQDSSPLSSDVQAHSLSDKPIDTKRLTPLSSKNYAGSNGSTPQQTIIPSRHQNPTTPAPIGPTISFDMSAACDVGQSEIIAAHTKSIFERHGHQVNNYIRRFAPDWLEAGQRWMTTGNWQPEIQSIVPATSAHSGIIATIITLTQPGDRIAMEMLTYAAIGHSATALGRRVVIVKSTQEGIDTDDLEKVCAQQHPKLLFIIATNQNPTGVTIDLDKRRAVAFCAQKHNMWLIEDCVFASLTGDTILPIASLAPERTIMVTSLSKSVSAGVRGGWLSSPPHLVARIHATNRLMHGGNSFIMTQLAADLVNSGDAFIIRDKIRGKIEERQTLAREIFNGIEFSMAPLSPFLWLHVPEPWKASHFRMRAAERNVHIDDEDEFKPVRMRESFHYVRICLSDPKTIALVKQGFEILRDLLDNGSIDHDGYA